MKKLSLILSMVLVTGLAGIAQAADPAQASDPAQAGGPPPGGNPLAALPDPYLQPGPAIEARVGIHRLMAANLVDAIRLATRQKPWNGFRMNDRTDALEALAKMSYEFFIVPGSHEGTKSRAAIMDNIDDFKAKTIATETAAMGLAHASRMHDEHGAMTAVGALIQSCNACHEAYMEPALLLPLPPRPGQ